MKLPLTHCLDCFWRYALKIHKKGYIADHSSEGGDFNCLWGLENLKRGCKYGPQVDHLE